MVFIVRCIFLYKNNGVSKLAVGKPKGKKRRDFLFVCFPEDTQLSCETCQQDTADDESSHQGETGHFRRKEIPFALLSTKTFTS